MTTQKAISLLMANDSNSLWYECETLQQVRDGLYNAINENCEDAEIQDFYKYIYDNLDNDTQERQFVCYESDSKGTFTLSEMVTIFDTMVNDEQKEYGTTFESWLDEMLDMQIYIELF